MEGAVLTSLIVEVKTGSEALRIHIHVKMTGRAIGTLQPGSHRL
jgi:hypothetical protein